MSVIELDGFVLNGTEYEMRDKLAQQRISEQIAGNTNPTEGNSELLDIRVGHDGTRYETAGDAVRGQILKVNSQLSESMTEISSELNSLGYYHRFSHSEGSKWVGDFTVPANSELYFKTVSVEEGKTGLVVYGIIGETEESGVDVLLTTTNYEVNKVNISKTYHHLQVAVTPWGNNSHFTFDVKINNVGMYKELKDFEDNIAGLKSVVFTDVCNNTFVSVNANTLFFQYIINKEIIKSGYEVEISINNPAKIVVGYQESGNTVFTQYGTVTKDIPCVLPIKSNYEKIGLYTNQALSTIAVKVKYRSGFGAALEKVKKLHKTFSVLGDSYSTFADFTEPLTNAQWYPADGEYQGNNNDVTNIEQTWWSLLAKENGFIMNQNNSYSGATICYDGWGTGATDAKNISFIERCKNLRGADVIIVEGGTNDSWVNVDIGEYKYGGWIESDFTTFRPSLAYVLWYLTNKYPSSKVVFMLNNGLKDTINESIETICDHYDVPLLKLNNIDKQNGHPSVQGMMDIKTQLITFLNTINWN